jgi:hypothetical protein
VNAGILPGTIEAYQQAFNWINQSQSPGVFVDILANVPGALDLGTPLPTMYVSNGDFVNNGAGFNDGTFGETLDLTVETVNVAVRAPEPSSVVLLVTGALGIALLLRRQGV